jgi:uncharacterized protein YprB with RNaseH-like and TPR domain
MATQKLRTFRCEFCGESVSTVDPRKRFCSKKHADRARGSAPAASDFAFTASSPDLKGFSRLETPQKQSILRGEAGHRIVMFDIEATHLKPNVGRILCCSFKPLGGEVYTFSGHEKRFKERDTFDDSKLAMAIIDELQKYDVIVGWNSKQFDVKFINSRAMRSPQGRTKDPQFHVDGMWSWRSKSQAWSGLANVQKFLLPDNAAEKTSIAWDKWMQALGWDKGLRETAMQEIIEHCELDVIVLEDVYLRMIEGNLIRSIRRDGGVL